MPVPESVSVNTHSNVRRPKNHASDIAGCDFFVVPTVTFRLLFVFVMLSHGRRRIVHFNVTSSPTAVWTGQQVVNAFPYGTASKYLLRDRDKIFGHEFQSRVKGMGIKEVKTAYRSPWQNPYCERVIGTLQRECVNRCIVLSLGKGSLGRVDHVRNEKTIWKIRALRDVFSRDSQRK